MSIVQTINLNLIPNSGPILVKCDQYDVGEGRIVAKLYDGDTAYTPAAGATAIIQGKKPDGHGFMYDATLSGNTVTADLTNQMSVVAGRVFVQFVITESDNRTGTFVFFLDVQPSALPADTEMSTSEYQVIEELLETARAINENFPYIGANGHWFYYDVEQGQYVDSGVAAGTSITIGTTTTLDAGDNATVTNTGDNINAVFNFGIPKGEKGDDGDPGATPDISMTATADATSSPNPSVNVTKTGTDEAPNFALAFSGLKGAQGATGEEGPEGPAGNGIVSITKTGTSGLVDTYTILFTNGQSTTFTVTNGQDGTGSGDMTKTVYDSTNAVADAGGIAAYVAAHAATGDFVSLKGVTDISSWTELKTFNIGNYYYKGDASIKFNDAPTGIPSKNSMSLSMAVRRFDDSTNKVFQELVLGYTSSSPDEKYIRKFFRVGNRGLTDVWSDWKEVAYTDDTPTITIDSAMSNSSENPVQNKVITAALANKADTSDIPDITGKADKVSGATSGDFAGLDANGNLTDSGVKPSNFATPAQLSNRNLIDNPWFTINQRGENSYGSTSSVYTVDRFLVYSYGTLTVNSGYVTVNRLLFQRLEESLVKSLLGKKVTLSLMDNNGDIYSGTITFPSSIPSSWTTYTAISNADFDVGLALEPNNYQFRITPTSTLNIKAVKMEVGEVSTLSMDATPNYADELLNCQKYFIDVTYCMFGYIHAASEARLIINTPIRMIKSPTLTKALSGVYIQYNGQSVSVDNTKTFSIFQGAGTYIEIDISGFTGLSPNYTCFLKIANGTKFQLSADL